VQLSCHLEVGCVTGRLITRFNPRLPMARTISDP